MKTPVMDQFAKVCVKTFLDDMEMHLKLKNLIPANNLKMFCDVFFYQLSLLNELCHNQVVKTCGLERIVNLLKMIVERQEQFKGSKCSASSYTVHPTTVYSLTSATCADHRLGSNV
uniref:Uncharacterized protein n=1 Tax=Romanomermis culicivorax TaxID=13658 RepID=A0A915KMB2_ROMCU